MAAQLPPQIQNQLMQLQQLQAQAQGIVAQRQQLEVQVRELEKTVEELDKVEEGTPIYRSVGALLIRAKDKTGLRAELDEQRETMEVRLTSAKRQEEKLRERLTSLQKEIEAALGRVGRPS